MCQLLKRWDREYQWARLFSPHRNFFLSRISRSLVQQRLISGVCAWVHVHWVCLYPSFQYLLRKQMLQSPVVSLFAPQWEAADAEIKVPSGENTELKRSPFKAWSRSAYSHTCYAYCQGFLPCLFLPFRSIQLHFFQTSPDFFPVLAVANTGSCVGPQNKIGHPAGCRFPLSARGI